MLSKREILNALGALSQIQIPLDGHSDDMKNLQQLETACINLPALNSFRCFRMISKNASINTCSSCSFFRYVCVSLECLLCLKENLQKQNEEAEKLLSVAQQRSVRTLLERVIYTGLSPNLLPGVQPQVKNATFTLPTSLSDMEKYECLSLVTLALVDLYKDDTFHGILVPQFLSAMVCALCQLTMVPLKKSADTFPQLQRERVVFQKHLDDLVTNLYQPLVIKELMVVEGNKTCPRWLKRGVGRLLTQRLHSPGGVFATVLAVRDAADCSAPTSLAHLEALARVITASPDLDSICPQVIKLLDSSEPEMVRMAVLCIKILHIRDAVVCDCRLLQPMMSPLTHAPSSEADISLCLSRLHKCFAVPASDMWCLPSHLLLTHTHVLFKLYNKIYQSASHNRQTVENLLWCILSNCDESVLPSVFRCLVYRESVPCVRMDEGAEFEFGDEGGVKLIPTEQIEHSLEEFGDCLMIFLERRDTNGILGNKLFLTLLEFGAVPRDLDTFDAYERQIQTVKLLTVLAENAVVQKSLNKNPNPIIKFLRSMIDSFLANPTCEIEIISLVLVVVSVFLNDFIHSKKNNWEVFSQLTEPLSKLKSQTNSIELKLLAEEAYEVIMSHGAVKPKQRATQNNSASCSDIESSKTTSACDDALRDACDPLLPVRGHAIMQLGKLLAAGDKQARAKKDHILFIFQESLKDEDSFLYLSAVEGLAVAAAEFPDTVIVTLTEQYTRTALPPLTRLKVGETLVRLTRLLGELVPVYKAELINALLLGTRDDDCLVRASSLSSLGELCRVLGFRIGPILAEVFTCARCIFSSDPSVEARRAAVMLVSLLLKGLQKDALTVLQDVLLELYHSLKHIYSSDRDDLTRLHAQLALEELNAGTLAFLFPRPQLTKQIYVLDPPVK